MEGVNRKLPGLYFKVEGDDGYLGEDFAVAVVLLLREVLTAAPAKGHEAVVFPSFLCGLYGLKALEAAMGLVVLAADKAFDLCRFAALPVVVVVAVSLIHATSAAEGVQIGPLADHEELIGPGGDRKSTRLNSSH